MVWPDSASLSLEVRPLTALPDMNGTAQPCWVAKSVLWLHWGVRVVQMQPLWMAKSVVGLQWGGGGVGYKCPIQPLWMAKSVLWFWVAQGSLCEWRSPSSDSKWPYSASVKGEVRPLTEERGKNMSLSRILRGFSSDLQLSAPASPGMKHRRSGGGF